MKIPHPHLPKIPGVVLVEIRPMMMLSTCHTAPTRMLAVLAYSAFAGGDVPATEQSEEIVSG